MEFRFKDFTRAVSTKTGKYTIMKKKSAMNAAEKLARIERRIQKLERIHYNRSTSLGTLESKLQRLYDRREREIKYNRKEE